VSRQRTVTVAMNNYLFERGGYWYYRRRVPRNVTHLDPRKEVKIATRISTKVDPVGNGRAAHAAAQHDAELEQYWADLLAGRNPEERKRTIRAISQAQALQVPYRAATDVARSPLPDILHRAEVLGREQQRLDASHKAPAPAVQIALRDATLGGTAKSGILVSALMETYYGIVAANHRQKSEHQLRAWKNRKKAATKNFIKAVADMDILDIEKRHAAAFHGWWSQRLIDADMISDSANKDLWNMKLMIETVCGHFGLADPAHFGGMSFAKQRNKRKAFKTDWVLKNIWPAGSLDGINEEAYDLTIVLIETGARPSEICGLNKKTIFLDANIPFIRIKPDRQELKTKASERDIPLVGRALEVMRKYPEGFSRYYLQPGNYGGLINYHLKLLQPEVKVEEGDKYQTVYCIRHLFKDRLRHARVEDEMKLALMGHDEDNSDNRDAHDYGEGFELQHKLDTLQKIAFPFTL
jgi:integrase